MKNAAIAGFAAGVAMAIGGAVGAVSPSAPRPAIDTTAAVMNPMIGGQAMMADRHIMENLAASPLHATFVSEMKASGVDAALTANGQFTVFAPTDAAFAAQGAQPKGTLPRRMGYLVVPGTYDSATLLRLINEAGGDARLRTVEGGMLVARMNGPTNIAILDEKGNVANIAIYDVRDRNGIVHVVDRVVEPSGPARQVAAN